MKIIVMHNAPDWDAITSAWLLKRYFSGWQDARYEFVAAGTRSKRSVTSADIIEKIGEDEMIHVDTGLGPLDHHQTQDRNVSAASLTWDFVKSQIVGGKKWDEKQEAISRIVKVVVETDHFGEVYWADPTADYHEFSLLGLLDGLKMEKPGDDSFAADFGMQCLDALLHNFENRIWAEKEIQHNGKEFQTSFGKALGFETINDDVLKLAQKMGYVLVVRKDPRKGYVRIKTLPEKAGDKGIDLTPVYEKLKAMDPQATWFLHVSKKMLLNGTTKNPDMKPTKLTLNEIIDVLQTL